MTHPGEQFYPEGVRWDDPIARGTLPDLLSTAAAEFGVAAGDRIPRPADQLRRTRSAGRDRSQRLPARRLRQEQLGRAVPRQFAGSSRQFLRRAEGRRPHRASVAARRRDRAVAQALGLRRARARHQQSLGAVADRAEISGQGPARPPDRLRGRSIGARSARRRRRCRIIPRSSPTGNSSTARRSRRNGRRSASMTSRCCNIPAAPPACRRARCSATAI